MKKVLLNNEENIINFLKNKTINKDEKSNYISAILSSDLINLNIMDIFLENNSLADGEVDYDFHNQKEYISKHYYEYLFSNKKMNLDILKLIIEKDNKFNIKEIYSNEHEAGLLLIDKNNIVNNNYDVVNYILENIIFDKNGLIETNVKDEFKPNLEQKILFLMNLENKFLTNANVNKIFEMAKNLMLDDIKANKKKEIMKKNKMLIESTLCNLPDLKNLFLFINENVIDNNFKDTLFMQMFFTNKIKFNVDEMIDFVNFLNEKLYKGKSVTYDIFTFITFYQENNKDKIDILKNKKSFEILNLSLNLREYDEKDIRDIYKENNIDTFLYMMIYKSVKPKNLKESNFDEMKDFLIEIADLIKNNHKNNGKNENFNLYDLYAKVINDKEMFHKFFVELINNEILKNNVKDDGLEQEKIYKLKDKYYKYFDENLCINKNNKKIKV